MVTARTRYRKYVVLVALLTTVSSCSPIYPADDTAPERALSYSERGVASYYADNLHGASTASGEPYNPALFTAAHRTLPFGTVVQVRNLSNNKAVAVTINDRGPFAEKRIIDLSGAAAKQLGMIAQGIAEVELTQLATPKNTSAN